MKLGTATMLAMAALTLWPPVSTAQSAPHSENAALFVAEHLDVLSIPSSIYARRKPGANTLKDYGFADFEKIDGGVRTIDQERQWLFGIRIVEDNGGIKVLCIQDGPRIDMSSPSQATVEVKLGHDGLFHGTGRFPQSDQCPPFQR
jgi:hypothetical protein